MDPEFAGGNGYSAMMISCNCVLGFYVLGFAAAFFLPETRGNALPERV